MKRSSSILKWLFPLLIVVVFLEVAGTIMLKRSNGYSEIRAFLRGSDDTDCQPQTTAHPYLNYIPTPGYVSYGFEQHNADGYRGPAVNLKKDSKTFRILFLGGSTTYNVYISDPDSTLTQQVKHILSARGPEWMSADNGYTGVEVINGGIPWGTSFEMLSGYLYKYRYYQPDLVIAHTGGNDAQAYYVAENYQPDYSHWRNTFNDIESLRPPFNLFFKSRFLSFILISGFYDRYVDGTHFVHYGDKLKADWFSDTTYLDDPSRNAFYNNIKSLTAEVRMDSSELMIVPFVVNAEYEFNPDGYVEWIEKNVGFLETLSSQYSIPYCGMTADVITDKSLWYDDCHLPSAGLEMKAEFIAESIIDFLTTSVGG